ncbi:CAP domain-containing protein [Candidatus Peregrinibacteria bacterium]|nr:CAP domain-containing protein [Candidatus Peregrinibacteria bacterium]
MEWKMLRLLNKDRRAYGLKPLFMQNDLRKVARAHSKDMARKDYFEHENLIGQNHADRLQEANVSETVSGENLAKIGGYAHPVHRAETGLMNSPGHRANILNESYNCVGVGLHISKKRVHYFTQNFAKKTLIFSKNPPDSVKLRRGLRLKCKPVGRVNLGIYRVLDQTGVIKEKGFPIKDETRINIDFNSAGKYKIQIFTGKKGREELYLSNEIHIKVKRGLF